MATVLCGTTSYADTEENLILRTTVSPTVSIEKSAASIENGSVNPQTGVHGGLQSVFTLQTNGTDDDYDFVMTSSILKEGGATSGYGYDRGGNVTLLFSNVDYLPSDSDVADAKICGNNNKNIIAYPVTVTVTSPAEAIYNSGHGTYGDCYVIKLRSLSDTATVTQMVGTTPAQGAYKIGQDNAGTYKATVTFTASFNYINTFGRMSAG